MFIHLLGEIKKRNLKICNKCYTSVTRIPVSQNVLRFFFKYLNKQKRVFLKKKDIFLLETGIFHFLQTQFLLCCHKLKLKTLTEVCGGLSSLSKVHSLAIVLD